MMTKLQFLFAAIITAGALIAASSSIRSQSQQPIIVQSASNPPVASRAGAPNPPASAPSSDAFVIAIRTLEQIKAANDEVLKRQQATLQQLEEMQQAAEELKIFSKRG